MTRPAFWLGNLEGGDDRLNAFRKNPITRGTIWLLTVAMAVPMLMLSPRAAHAQTQQGLTIIVADLVDLKTKKIDQFSREATDAVAVELSASGQGRFSPFSSKDVRAAAAVLHIQVPSNPNDPLNLSTADYTRVARELHADGILTGDVFASTNSKGKVTGAARRASRRPSRRATPHRSRAATECSRHRVG